MANPDARPRGQEAERERMIEILQAVPELCIERHYGPTPHHNGCVTTPDYDAMADAVLAAGAGTVLSQDHLSVAGLARVILDESKRHPPTTDLGEGCYAIATAVLDWLSDQPNPERTRYVLANAGWKETIRQLDEAQRQLATATTQRAQAAAQLKALREDYVELEGQHCDQDDRDCCGACHHDLRAQLATATTQRAQAERERDEAQQALLDQPNVQAELLQVVIERDDAVERTEQAERQVQTLRDEAQWLWRDWEARRTEIVRIHEARALAAKPQWLCEFCYARAYTNTLPASWNLVWSSAVCGDCAPRVHRDGGYGVVKCGAYAEVPDPRPWPPAPPALMAENPTR